MNGYPDWVKTPQDYQKWKAMQNQPPGSNLVLCPACSKRISPDARTCPQCGHPMAVATAVITIEKTGKKWKKLQISSLLLIIFGILCLITGIPIAGASSGVAVIGFISLGFGIITRIYARVGAWWHHG
jgi:hypothetical protein